MIKGMVVMALVFMVMFMVVVSIVVVAMVILLLFTRTFVTKNNCGILTGCNTQSTRVTVSYSITATHWCKVEWTY